MVAAAGYRNVEGYGALYADEAKVAELNQHLGASGLKMPTGHFGIDQLEKEPDRVLEIAKAVGIETIYCPYLMPDQRPDSGKGWHAFGQRLQKAAAPYRDAGLGFGWHNHDFEFRKTADGALPQTAIFEGGPDLEWEADIAWVIRGGADPLRVDPHHEATASPPCTSRTSPPPARTPTRTAGPTSATARSTGRG